MEGKKTNKNTKMNNFKQEQNFGENTNVNRVSFVGWLAGGWWLVGCVFFLHTQIFELAVYPSYTRP